MSLPFPYAQRHFAPRDNTPCCPIVTMVFTMFLVSTFCDPRLAAASPILLKNFRSQ